jgi:hypothetical protein
MLQHRRRQQLPLMLLLLLPGLARLGAPLLL